MKKVLYTIIFLIIAHFNSYSQGNVNNYKYVIIPNQYEFLKQKDEYQINSLTKFLFNKYGYEAFMQDESFPDELNNNRCLALMADVIKDSGLFNTKLQIILKDCKGKVIQSSKVGESREKQYSKAYNLSLRDAFSTFQNLDYVYKPNDAVLSKANPEGSEVTNAEKQEEITRLKQEIKTLKEAPQNQVVAVEKPMVRNDEVIKSNTKEILNEKEKAIVEKVTTDLGTLYAQPIDKGFQIVDTTPKKVMILRPSGVKDVFTVEGKKAIVFKKGDDWMYSESGDILKGEAINIKF